MIGGQGLARPAGERDLLERGVSHAPAPRGRHGSRPRRLDAGRASIVPDGPPRRPRRARHAPLDPADLERHRDRGGRRLRRPVDVGRGACRGRVARRRGRRGRAAPTAASTSSTTYNSRVRRVTPDGIIHTVVGCGYDSTTCDGTWVAEGRLRLRRGARGRGRGRREQQRLLRTSTPSARVLHAGRARQVHRHARVPRPRRRRRGPRRQRLHRRLRRRHLPREPRRHARGRGGAGSAAASAATAAPPSTRR